MKTLIFIISVFVLIFLYISTSGTGQDLQKQEKRRGESVKDKVVKTDQEWKNILTPEQYRVTREKGTERPFTGKLDDFWEKGSYKCIGCGSELFSSETKYDAGCGWPSFYEANKENIVVTKDYSHGMIRDEVSCAKCGAHLGHVFDDGPLPTSKRYCMNSVSLDFEKKDE